MFDLLVADLRHMTAAWDASPGRVLFGAVLRAPLHPQLRVAAYYRFSQVVYRYRALRWLALYCKARSIRACAVEIHPAADIGPGLALGHGVGIVIGHAVVAGRDLALLQGVTIGHGRDPSAGQPRLGNRVLIGAGAVLLGGIVVGDNVKIGANSVVLADVPAGTTVVGVWK